MTYALGISYGFHDATAALARDGRLVAMAAEERFTRQKHDANFPAAAVEYCLTTAGIDASALARVVYHESPSQTFTRVVASSLAAFPRTRREFTGSMKAWFGRKLWVENELSRRLGVEPERITFLSHHQSHAMQAFLGSGFDEAAVLTVDAVGEWASTTLASARRGKNGAPELETLQSVDFPHSLGLFYSAMTAYLGFVPMDGECSVMALAAFGVPRFADDLRRVVSATADGGFEVDHRYFNFHRYYDEPWTDELVALLGPPRHFKDALPFDTLAASAEARAVPAESQRFADVAASVQLVFEEAMVRLVRRLKRLTGAKRLCLAGGAALNCVANARILREELFEDVYVPPDPGDGGAAAGAALFGAHGATASDGRAPYVPYVGPRLAAESRDVEAMLAHVDPARFRRFVKRGYRPPRGERWTSRRHEDQSELVTDVADLLARGAVVGWVQGAAESGPRALGARSILIRPDDLALARRLSSDIKDRARYRPYALAMSEEHAARVLVDPRPDCTLYRWMQIAESVRPDAWPLVAAGVHVDGTTRPQICRGADQPRFHALLRAVGARTGLDCLVNTSFNESGAPIVTTALEALSVFARTGMDALVLDDLIIRKER